jgi:predicted CopG family antitoxin
MIKMIKVSDSTHSELNKLGERGETFEDIVKRLIEEHYRLEDLEK